MKTPERFEKEQYIDENMQIFASEKYFKGKTETHWHDFYEMEYILSGTGVYEINGKKLTFSKGSVFLMTPVDFHAVEAEGGTRIINVMFSERWIDKESELALYRAPSPLAASFSESEYETAEIMFRAIVREYEEGAAYSERMLRNLLECAAVTLLRRTEVPEGSKETADFNSIQKSLMYLRNHFRETITLKEAAAEAGLSPAYFSDKFHQYTGETFRKHLVRMRCEYAQRMLIYTDAPVTEICYASGFSTLSHFLRTFKEFSGMTPRRWRCEEKNKETLKP